VVNWKQPSTKEDVSMRIVENIGIDELEVMSKKLSEPLVKAVVDVARRVLVVDAGLHTDEELFLLETDSKQHDLWGINLGPDSFGTDDFVEFDSMINIRPAQGNRSRGVEDLSVREHILAIVAEKVHG
jgi:hypothetical protein